MKVDLIVVGKTDQAEVRSLVAAYLKRLNFYTKVTLTELPDLKNTRSLSAESQKRQEGEALLRQFGEGDYVVLLDEKGAQLRSVDFALWLQKRMDIRCPAIVIRHAFPARRKQITRSSRAQSRFCKTTANYS